MAGWMRTRRAGGLVLGVLCVVCCGGWGWQGHSIIAEIAWREMTPAAQQRATEILNGGELPAVASWADQVRRDEAYRWTGPLHYVNLAAGTTEFRLERDCPEAGCVVSAVRDFGAMVVREDADEKTRREALMFLIHFVGDLHQPLHAGRPEDRGGNDIGTVFFGQERNLHSVWDSGILGAGDERAWPLIAEELAGKIDAGDRLAWLADADGGDLAATAGRWAFESFRLAERYCYPVAPGTAIGAAYVDQTLPVVRLRLMQGGVRLGAVLNGLLDPGSGGMGGAIEVGVEGAGGVLLEDQEHGTGLGE